MKDQEIDFGYYAECVFRWAKSPSSTLMDLTPAKIYLLHMSSAMLHECVEFIEAVEANDKVNMREELGDIYFYATAILNYFSNGRELAEFSDPESVEQAFMEFDYTKSNLILLSCCGDIFDLFKKYSIYNKEINYTKTREKLGILFEVVLPNILKYYFGPSASMDDIRLENYEKLRKRFGDKYSDEGAQARADKEQQG